MAITDQTNIDRVRKYLGYPITGPNRQLIRDALQRVVDVAGSDDQTIETILRQLDSLTSIVPVSAVNKSEARELIQQLSTSINLGIYSDIYSSSNSSTIIRG